MPNSKHLLRNAAFHSERCNVGDKHKAPDGL